MKHLEQLQSDIDKTLMLSLLGKVDLSEEAFLYLCHLHSVIEEAKGTAFEEWFRAANDKLFDLCGDYLASESSNSFHYWLLENSNMVDWLETNLPPFDTETSLGWIQAYRERRNTLSSD